MATESGVGGKAIGPFYEYRVTNWQLESNPNLQEDTNSSQVVDGAVAHTHRISIKMDHKLTMEVLVGGEGDTSDIADISSQPEESDLTEGAELAMNLKTGSSAGMLWYTSWTFIVDTVNLVGCDANGLARYTVTLHSQEDKPDLVTNPF